MQENSQVFNYLAVFFIESRFIKILNNEGKSGNIRE